MKDRDTLLDLVRGVSALCVMLGHLRAMVFLDHAGQGGIGAAGKFFYLVTGLGHQAVMVFFVLSGYFVGGSALEALRAGRFCWATYAAARLSRLWVVLVPALGVTLLLDAIGTRWCPEAYSGGYHARYQSGPSADSPPDHGLVTALGNLVFLQTVRVPVFGTNGPLWSLANEFWYYVVFPLLAWACWSGGRRGTPLPAWHRAAALALAAGCLLVLPWGLIRLGGIWGLGAAVWWAARNPRFPAMARGSAWRWGGGVLLAGVLAAGKLRPGWGTDWGVGLAFALWLPALVGPGPAVPGLRTLATGLSEVSYTLYVVHFPFLFLGASLFLGGHQLPLGWPGFLFYLALTFAALAFSWGMWWLFERNTGWVRKRLQ